MTTTEADLLETIVAATRRIVEVRSAGRTIDDLQRAMGTARPRGDRFRSALRRQDRMNVIAECKRRSPSVGVIRADYDPASIARSYESGGAAAISVLTEPTFFDGALDHLTAVRAAVETPLLRKDFIVSEYQLFEAAAAGADAALLIVAALAQPELCHLQKTATELGLAVLVEVHSDAELARALDAGTTIVGVNARNLRTLQIDPNLAEALIGRMSGDVTAVAESGLRSADDLRRLRRAGYHAFLIGERLMKENEPGDALRALIN